MIGTLTLPEQERVLALGPTVLPQGNPENWTQDDLTFAWCLAYGYSFAPLSPTNVDTVAYATCWKHCHAHQWVPLFASHDLAMVASPRLFDPVFRRDVVKFLRTEIYWVGCPEEDFGRTLAELGEPVSAPKLPPPVVIPSSWDLEPESGVPDPHRRGVLRVIEAAHFLGASDIFFDDDGMKVLVRFRLSGVAEVFPPIPARRRATFIGALKKMAGINSNERYKPHDARFNSNISDGNVIEIRASFAPMEGGETIALRLQDSRKMVREGLSIPIPQEFMPDYLKALRSKGGMILLTGPTGSGKTTTLYASLLSLDRSDLVIRTVEDPVEITIPGITQTAVGGNTGLEFGKMVKSFLRLNPDVILVGEIRDEETAISAIEASLTGHTLLSTLHSMDAPGTIARFVDMVRSKDIRGSLAASLSVIVSQRLAPRLCVKCREPRTLSPRELGVFEKCGLPPPERLYRRHGCPECGNGFRGRVPLFEVLIMTPELGDAITAGADFSVASFRKAWYAQGGKPMGVYALETAAKGEISFEDAENFVFNLPKKA